MEQLHKLPLKVSRFSGGASQINSNKVYISWKLNNEDFHYVFFPKIKGFEILRSKAIFTVSFLSSSFIRLDNCRNALFSIYGRKKLFHKVWDLIMYDI